MPHDCASTSTTSPSSPKPCSPRASPPSPNNGSRSSARPCGRPPAAEPTPRADRLQGARKRRPLRARPRARPDPTDARIARLRARTPSAPRTSSPTDTVPRGALPDTSVPIERPGPRRPWKLFDACSSRLERSLDSTTRGNSPWRQRARLVTQPGQTSPPDNSQLLFSPSSGSVVRSSQPFTAVDIAPAIHEARGYLLTAAAPAPHATSQAEPSTGPPRRPAPSEQTGPRRPCRHRPAM